MHVQRLANFRNRVAYLGNDLAPLGTSIQNPDIEYHKMAESMGWWAKGPIKDPADLAPALKEAVAVVKSGQPALLERVDAAAMKNTFALIVAGMILGQGAAFAASAENGKTAYVKNGCWQCHGFVGQGSLVTSNGTVLANTKLPLETFISFVRNSNRAMPPYREAILSDADLADIYAYLQSVPKPADASSIQLLK